ncbi:MFS transporter [Legionella worsleiensis]|uniref:Major facilitator superfamily transporter protein n=1 Tax=Legionella worsleiensis TaxID=45076 RepID=A0A0W1AER8_9GAMM|nr:MFS transporter [Legionella worsleiensis]KTD79836.1 major facilitator superfamily transporter protein [Legionella worsleiensis]STY32347.1 major facilitator superfamily protein [Legionella worsleiensis]
MLIRRYQLLIVIAASILTLIATDILLPSLPQIADTFAVSSHKVKMLLSIFMAGELSTVLIWGVIADLLGRRQTLFLGMLIFCIGSIMSLYADSINLLLVCRFLQGAGSVVVPVAGWALIQDLYPKDEGARMMSFVGTLVAVLPLFAPAIGGKIDVLYGWHMNLYGIAFYAAILCLAMLLLPQTLSMKNTRVSIPDLNKRLRIYGTILKNKTFISYIALFGLLNCGQWCFLTVAPFYYAHAHISPDKMGLLLMITSMGFLLGAMTASRLFKKFGVDNTMALGILIALVSSLLLLASSYNGRSNQPIFSALVISLYVFSSALLWGASTSRALQCFDDFRGSASAVRSLILIGFSALGTFAGKLLHHESLFATGIILFALALTALWVFNTKGLRAERMTAEVAY